MDTFISKIPNIGPEKYENSYPSNYRHYILKYVFENNHVADINLTNTLWLEFGVATGNTINIISKYTKENIYGFDSFEGLPEKWRDGFDKGAFDRKGELPEVNANVKLIKGWFTETLPIFLKEKNEKISFIHIDCDLYSSTKFVLDTVKPYLNNNCILVFDELVNYPGFDGDTGELLALYNFIKENNIKYEWIGMNGTHGMTYSCHQNVAIKININH